MTTGQIRKEVDFIKGIKLIGLILTNIILYLLISKSFDVVNLAWVSILQLVINLLILNINSNKQLIFISIFLVLSWIFHCGQIVKYAFNISGEVPLPFYNYGTNEDFVNAFIFYFCSQTLIVFGYLICKKTSYDSKVLLSNSTSTFYLAITLIVIGIVPRLYIDLSKLLVSIRSGYVKIYDIYVPTVLNSLAFICDAGFMLLLLAWDSKRAKAIVFYSVLLYKFLIMFSGSRQYAVCFLLVFTIVYFWIIKEINFRKKIILFIGIAIAVILIDFIGKIRSQGFKLATIGQMFDIKNNTVIGDSLGEFGSAYCSLIAAIKQVPDVARYGYGRSYLAAILSAIPTLVSRIPILKESVTFTTLLNNTEFFGGSYIGEFYYNFSWFGILAAGVLGYVIRKCQNGISNRDNVKGIMWNSLVYMWLLLYIRGYITDMAQSVIWLWFIVFVLFAPNKSDMRKELLNERTYGNDNNSCL